MHMWHLADPLELYLVREMSAYRQQAGRDKEQNDELMQTVLDEIAPYGLIPWDRTSRGDWSNGIQQRRRVLAVMEIVPYVAQGCNYRLRQVLEWLRYNGNDVDLVVRESIDASNSQHAEAVSWASNLNISLQSDDVYFTNLVSTSESTPEYDLALFGVWFWRQYSVADAGSAPGCIPYLVGPWFHEHSPTAKVVLMSDDVHHVRCLGLGSACNITEYIKATEMELYSTADLTLAITETDANAFRELAPSGNIATLPMAVAPYSMLKVTEGRKSLGPARVVQSSEASTHLRLLFIGSFHDANKLSVAFLVNEVLPVLHEKFELEVHLTLAGWEQQQFDSAISCDWHCENAVKVMGVVDDLVPLMRSAFALAVPTMVDGTGVSTKVFLGLQTGMETITTPSGTAGISCADTRTCPHLHVASKNGSEFARVVASVFASFNATNAADRRSRAGMPYPLHQTAAPWVNATEFAKLFEDI